MIPDILRWRPFAMADLCDSGQLPLLHARQFTLAGRPATCHLQTVHDSVQVSARFRAAVPSRTLRTCRRCTRSSSSPLCFWWSSGLPSLQLVKLWPKCICACRPLLLELSSLQRAEVSFHRLIQMCLKNIPVPLEYAYSALETILLFDGLYKCTIYNNNNNKP